MNKEILKGVTIFTLMVALAIVTAVVSANAQSANKMVTDIPFEFSIDYKTMPAGQYTVQTVATASDALLIQSADGSTSALRPSEATAPMKNKRSARLVFHRYGQRYFLAEVWNGTDNAGRQLMKSLSERAIEQELASIPSKSDLAQSTYETVEVVAVLR